MIVKYAKAKNLFLKSVVHGKQKRQNPFRSPAFP